MGKLPKRKANRPRPLNEQPGPPDREWTAHEHTAPVLESEAQHLAAEAGSPELAKQIVETAAERAVVAERPEEHLAHQWGFASGEALVTRSTRLTAEDGAEWWATPLAGNRWRLWNADSLALAYEFESLEDARRHLGARAE